MAHNTKITTPDDRKTNVSHPWALVRHGTIKTRFAYIRGRCGSGYRVRTATNAGVWSRKLIIVPYTDILMIWRNKPTPAMVDKVRRAISKWRKQL